MTYGSTHRNSEDTYVSMTSLAVYVATRRDVAELSDEIREKLEALLMEVKSIRSRDRRERLDSIYRQLADDLVRQGLNERYIAPDEPPLEDPIDHSDKHSQVPFIEPTTEVGEFDNTETYVSNPVAEVTDVDKREDESFDRSYTDDRDAIQRGGRGKNKSVRFTDTRRSGAFRKEPYSEALMVNMCLGAVTLFVALLPR